MRFLRFFIMATFVCSLIFFMTLEAANTVEEKIPNPTDYVLTNDFSEYAEMTEFEEIVKQHLQIWKTVGATVAIVKDGKLVYAKGFGHTDDTKTTEVQPYHLFRVASVSKLFTAVAIMQLVEQGKISLSDKVFGRKGILNDAVYCKVKDKKMYAITIEDLLEHTAGWKNSKDPLFKDEEIAKTMSKPLPIDEQTIIKYVMNEKLDFKVGEKYSYSNFGYMMLGKIIEKKSGISYEKYIKENVLNPISAYTTRIGKNKEKYALEVGYYDARDRDTIRKAVDGSEKMVASPYSFNLENLGAAGAWLASAPDILRLVTAIDNEPTRQDIISPASVLAMTNANQDHDGYAMGWAATSPTRWWRTGTLAGTSARITKEPNGIIWAVIVNTSYGKGHSLSREIDYMMQKALTKVTSFPQKDLFEVSYPPLLAKVE